ncbi:uncharacterized protein KQ657_000407 [Scheffersomyces spartinae]|uniref:Ubiquitin-like protease family profile domain-containing protein n=1 Tax=Scheffersomyces spartinae TaxID=45513 RepID=A0A9P7V992_9ASCO|nr:uncharacterized protein KQ657_000407 [Scheffersomyces spartinae]KAG7193717.1 hypothetical protein KQ657_000407 [Scheffersomyces spartinae]
MVPIVRNEDRGFLISHDSEPFVDEGIIVTNGLNLLPWNEVFPKEPDQESNDSEQDIETEPKRKKLSKHDKREQKLQKKANAARNKRLRRQEQMDTSSSSSIPPRSQYNPYSSRIKIKELYSKIIALNKTTVSDKVKEQKNVDRKLFQYHLIAMYLSDLELYLPGEWLNDNNILFAYELLNYSFLQDDSQALKQIQLLYPSLVQLFLHYPDVDDLASMLPPEIKQAKFIFLPINFIDDYEGIDLEEINVGDHWALTVLDILSGELLVYDSMVAESNESNTKLVRELILRLLKCESVFGNQLKHVQVKYMKCDQQTNFDDCGIYVAMITSMLIYRLISTPVDQTISLDIGRVKFDPLSGRSMMLDLVYKVMQSVN